MTAVMPWDHANATVGEHDCERIQDGDAVVFIPKDHDGRDLDGQWIETDTETVEDVRERR